MVRGSNVRLMRFRPAQANGLVRPLHQNFSMNRSRRRKAVNITVASAIVAFVLLAFVGTLFAGVGGVLLWLVVGVLAVVAALAVSVLRRTGGEERR